MVGGHLPVRLGPASIWSRHNGRKFSLILLLVFLALAAMVWRPVGSLLLSAALARSVQPVDTAVYRTGAWCWSLLTDEERALYEKGGFNLIRYDPQHLDWAVSKGMRFIGSVTREGVPQEINQPYETADGLKFFSLGFNQLNFNTPAVAEWWSKNIPQVVRNMRAAERVAFWKVHNEFSYSSTRPFDYSPGSIAGYRKWLQSRYRSIGDLNRRWQTSYAAFEAIDPPRTDLLKQLPNWLEWRRFTCWNLANYFGSTGDLIRSAVPGAKASCNFYPAPPLQAWDLFELAKQTDYMALDLYEIGRWPRLLEFLDLGRSAASAHGKPFLMMEYHAGPNDWAPVVRGRDLAIEANTALARESRALMWYMWRPAPAGTEQGIHGMLDSEGRPTERYTVVAEVSAQTARLAPLLLKSRTPADVAIVMSEDNEYLFYAQGKPPKQRKQPWSNLGHILDAARIQWDFVDVAALPSVNLSRYKAIILGHVPMLGDDVFTLLDSYVQKGGTLITHPDAGLRDGVGLPRKNVEFEEAGKSNGLWTVRLRRAGVGGELVTTSSGKGRRVSCAWELPDPLDSPDEIAKRASSYAGMLAAAAGIQPALTVENVPSPAELDARRLESGNTTLLFLTWKGKGPLRNVGVTVPRLRAAGDAILFDRATGSSTRIPLTRSGDGVQFPVPQVDPDVIVLLGGPWQPVVGIDAPKSLHPGDRVLVNVTVDNLDAQPVSGKVRLRASGGWNVTPAGRTDFAGLAPGARATLGYRVTIPAAPAIDRFAIENPLTADVEFTSGRTGSLSVRHLPFVQPPLDVTVTYHDQILNPWQQLSPPIMRWGWNREVHISPPPPIPIKAVGEAVINVSNSPSLAGRQVTLAVSGPGQARVEAVKGGAITLTDRPQSIPVKFQLSSAGPHRLTVRAGDRQTTADFVGGVDEETARVTLAARQMVAPRGWDSVAQLAVGAREAPAYGQPVTVKMALPEQQVARAAVFAMREENAGGPALVASSISATSVAIAADVPMDDVSTYLLAVAREGVEVPRPERVRTETNGDRLTVRGDNYAVTFNRAFARTESIEIAGRPALSRPSGMVATPAAGGRWEVDSATTGASLNVTSSPVEVTVELERSIGPVGEGLTCRERWVFQARHISVVAGCRNPTKQPIAISHVGYRLGIDSAQTGWRLIPTDDSLAESARLPGGYWKTGGVKVVDWRDTAGNGLLLTLGRCVPFSRTTPATIQHSSESTEISIADNFRVEPLPSGTVFAEFELWPHTEASFVAKVPVTAIYVAAAGK